ncbi:hypothetical protein G9A89_009608 [Geosiphon pyriformis]|nr:hypothetical protein G9A89_009608 [Geosiphon pyriformis]
MTDFGLSNGYKVHDGLDQGEVFSPLLWRIFYDLLLCKVKRHEQLCGYRIDSKFVVKTGKVKSVGEITSYFAAGAFVDDTIWYALNIASEFFKINNISMNNDKTVAIPINQGVKVVSLNICGQLIFITKKGKAHRYLGIFLFTERLSKSSVVKTHSDVRFFVNVVLRKAITDKQYSYLVSADVMVRKDLKSKAGLPCDFSDAALHYLFLYDLKTFEFLDLQVLGWASLNPLQFSVKLRISPINNFLAGIVKIFLDNELSLVNNFPNVFHSLGYFPMLSILENSLYFDSGQSMRRFGIAFDNHLLSKKSFFLPSSTGSGRSGHLNILESNVFFTVKDGLHDVWSDCFEVYTDGSLKRAGSANVTCGATAYFLALDLSVGVVVYGLLSSTLAELQTVALFLECVPSSYKDFKVVWVKVKGHFGVSGNVKADLAAEKAIRFPFTLLARVCEQFLVAEDTAVSGNAYHFVKDIFQSVNHAYWEAGLGYNVVPDVLVRGVDWVATAKVWHSNSHMLAEFTNQSFLNLCTYLMKAVHRHLLVMVWKRLYNKKYLGVMCLLYSKVEFLDHAFMCAQDVVICNKILAEASTYWVSVTGVCVLSFSAILQALSICFLDVGLYFVVCKGFVLSE